MGNLYERIYALCEKKGIKGAKMCADVGLSKGLLTDLKMGRKKGVSAVTAQKIASYFGVSVGYLLGEETAVKEAGVDDTFSESKRALIAFVKTVPDDKAEMILRVVQSIVNSEN